MLRATFHVTADPPHKARLSVAELVQRAKLLHGKPRLFSEGDALYVDKARRNPGASFLLGADALERLLDPKWGPEPLPMLYEIAALGCRFLVLDRGRLHAVERARSGEGTGRAPLRGATVRAGAGALGRELERAPFHGLMRVTPPLPRAFARTFSRREGKNARVS